MKDEFSIELPDESERDNCGSSRDERSPEFPGGVFLLRVRARPGKQVQLLEGEIKMLCVKARDIFMQQPILLELEAPIKICGDIHGQYYDLLRLFEYGGFPPEANYLFLGDYVDRGKQSLETICLLLAYKIKYPENFFVLRGNHECASINRIYGFYDECERRYNIKLWKTFTDCFNCLPVAAIVDEKIFCMHGGLSPELNDMDQIKRVLRPTDVPDTGLLCDLLWSDPDRDIIGWGENDRGVSFTFGEDIVVQFLRRHDLDLICRAHQAYGYEFFARRHLVTLFSAPNYCGEFDNAGAMMSVDDTLMCSFQILKPAEKRQRFNYAGVNQQAGGAAPGTARPRFNNGVDVAGARAGRGGGRAGREGVTMGGGEYSLGWVEGDRPLAGGGGGVREEWVGFAGDMEENVGTGVGGRGGGGRGRGSLSLSVVLVTLVK
eukprot:jgi/Undpi1/3631/HiC_scaffold_16.g07001.m1